MALESVHPKYTAALPDWETMRDVYKGERHVKEQTTKYLKPTKGMLLDGFGKAATADGVNIGQETYDAYLLRAVLPDYVREAVEALLGLLHSQPAVIEVPEGMEDMLENLTAQGEDAQMLLKRINEEQLLTGRLGLLLDLPTDPDPANPTPYVALYVAESIRNWDDGSDKEGRDALSMVVLDESGYRRTNFEWHLLAKYRTLLLHREGMPNDYKGPLDYYMGVFEQDGGGAPTFVEADLDTPKLRGRVLEEVPFVFVNTKDIVADPDVPPLLGLANRVLAIYRAEADYRQNLFLQGQDTLVVIGDLKTASRDPNELAASADTGEAVRVGTGAMIHLEAGGDAKMVGVSATGLSEQRTSLENDRRWAEGRSGTLSAEGDDSAASGEALRTRVGTRTASLNQVALTGAAALEWMLKCAARWMGKDDSKIKVTPNLEFADFQMSGENLTKLMAGKQAGAPLSAKSLHRLMAQGGITELTYEEEVDEIKGEAALAPPAGTTAGGDPDDAPPAPDATGAAGA